MLSAGWIDTELNPELDLLPADAVADWQVLRDVRVRCNAVLEVQRERKALGKALEADLEITAPAAIYSVLQRYESSLAAVFLVSDVRIARSDSDELSVVAHRAKLARCARCWRYVAPLPPATPLCTRCAAVLRHNH